jgi:uncharacterized membrane protein YeaQ/YmgE (transglycosylase-associated protein family)
MSLIVFLIVMFIAGLITGGLARLLLPGPDPMSLGQTALIGIAGSFIADLITLGVFHRRYGGGLILSVLCSAVLVYLVRRSRERSLAGRGVSGRRGFF